MTRWIDILKPILRDKINEAVDEAIENFGKERLPWVGDECFGIMAEAALCVLRGMADAEKYMAENDLLKD